MIKYIESVLWRVAKRLSYIEDARCIKVKSNRQVIRFIRLRFWKGLKIVGDAGSVSSLTGVPLRLRPISTQVNCWDLCVCVCVCVCGENLHVCGALRSRETPWNVKPRWATLRPYEKTGLWYPKWQEKLLIAQHEFFMLQWDRCSWLKVVGMIDRRMYRVYGQRGDRRFTRNTLP